MVKISITELELIDFQDSRNVLVYYEVKGILKNDTEKKNITIWLEYKLTLEDTNGLIHTKTEIYNLIYTLSY